MSVCQLSRLLIIDLLGHLGECTIRGCARASESGGRYERLPATFVEGERRTGTVSGLLAAMKDWRFLASSSAPSDSRIAMHGYTASINFSSSNYLILAALLVHDSLRLFLAVLLFCCPCSGRRENRGNVST